jgi:hypothetical protein
MRGPWATLRAAAGDRLSGSAQIARTAAEAITALPKADMGKALEVLLAGHPSMAALWRLATDVLSARDPADGARAFLESLEEDRRAGTVLAPMLPPWVLTMSYSSSVLDCLRRARLRLVTCMESQPGGEGARTAEAIAEWGRARLIRDQEGLRTVPAAAVVVGCDAVTPGAVVNKVKTRALAESARLKQIPCYVVAGWAKFVSESLPVEGAFEPVPLQLFTGIATPEGVLSPGETRDRASEAAMHQDLRPLLARLRAR